MENKLLRICGKCQTILTEKNTNGLGKLAPYCNDCVIKHEPECKHKWADYLLLSNPPKKQCILCGYTDALLEINLISKVIGNIYENENL